MTYQPRIPAHHAIFASNGVTAGIRADVANRYRQKQIPRREHGNTSA